MKAIFWVLLLTACLHKKHNEAVQVNPQEERYLFAAQTEIQPILSSQNPDELLKNINALTLQCSTAPDPDLCRLHLEVLKLNTENTLLTNKVLVPTAAGVFTGIVLQVATTAAAVYYGLKVRKSAVEIIENYQRVVKIPRKIFKVTENIMDLANKVTKKAGGDAKSLVNAVMGHVDDVSKKAADVAEEVKDPNELKTVLELPKKTSFGETLKKRAVEDTQIVVNKAQKDIAVTKEAFNSIITDIFNNKPPKDIVTNFQDILKKARTPIQKSSNTP